VPILNKPEPLNPAQAMTQKPENYPNFAEDDAGQVCLDAWLD
jgi:hypothetical protein